MARPIDRDPADPSVPLWLSLGRRAAEITDQGAKAGLSRNAVAESIHAATSLPVHRAREYERAYRFLVAHYAEAVAERKVDTNFAAVSQLLALHRLDSAKAAELGPSVLAGTVKANALRQILDKALEAQAGDDRSRILESRRRVAGFSSDARLRLLADPLLLGIGPIDEVQPVRVGHRFAPDLLMRQGQQWIAVEIVAAGPLLTPHHVGRYLGRLAQLEQKFERAILVLPHDRGDIAEILRSFQAEWIGREAEVVLLEEAVEQENA